MPQSPELAAGVTIKQIDKPDTTFLISHRLPLEKAPEGYKNFKEQQNEWTKVVLKPGMESGT